MKGYIWIAAAAVVLVVMVVWAILDPFGSGSECPPDCPPPTPTMVPGTPPPPETIQISLASSNTKENWINAVVEQFNQEQHTIASGATIIVQPTHVTSGGSQRDILAEKIQPTVWSPGDSSWVDGANEIWRPLYGHELVSGDCLSTILAPTGFAMWRPMAEALGWPDKPISWDDLMALSADPAGWASLGHSEWGEFRFGHPHPTYSNVGLQIMTALAHSTDGNTSGLTPEQVYSEEVVEAFAYVEQNTYHYGKQSRNLINRMVSRGPDYLHAVATSEAETLKTNFDRQDELHFQLVFIFPAEGTFWSEHPYCIINTKTGWVSEQQVEAAEIFRDYLLEPAQQALAIDNYLRPVDQSIPLHCPLCIEDGTDPRVTTELVPALQSPSAETAEAIKDVFRQTKKKATVILLLDTSGSMQGDKIKNAVEGAISFIDRLDCNDKVHAFGFGGKPATVYPLGEGGRKCDIGEELQRTLSGLFAASGTPLNDAICSATELASSLQAEDEANGERRLYGIVLLSDGEDTSSTRSQNQMFLCLPTGESIEGVKIFTIAYGADADADLMKRIATRTNGKSYTADPENIDKIYTDISSEQ
jgi:Ca-activated chloride channel family protein